MSEKTNIEWCDASFSAWLGCTEVSTGCLHCWARDAIDRRFRRARWGDFPRMVTSNANWAKPLAWNRKAQREGRRIRVFCSPLSDVFENRPELVAPRGQLCDLIDSTGSLNWLLLTKRPENIGTMVGWGKGWGPWPPNVWLGYSASTQAELDKGLPHLLACPAAVRFLSLEPLLEEIQLPVGDGVEEAERRAIGLLGCGMGMDGASIDWLILGGESGPKSRPCDLAWIRSIVEQCRAAGVPCFIKQLGAYPSLSGIANDECLRLHGHLRVSPDLSVRGFRVHFRHRKGGDPTEWPEDLRVRELPTLR